MESKVVKKEYNEKEFKQILLTALKEKPNGATLTDMVVSTGLSTDWTEFTLRKLLGEYPVSFETNEKNELVYVFDFSPKTKSFNENIQDAFWNGLNLLWKGFVFLFKVWIVVMLFTYMLFNIIVLALAIVGITRSGDLLKVVFEIIAGIFKGSYELLFGKDKSNTSTVQQVFSYVFGESKKLNDSLATEKNILRLIRQNKGKLYNSDIIQLTGSTWREAEHQAAQLMANYQGDAKVNEDGIIIYEFPDLANATDAIKNEILPIWKRPIPEIKMNDNDRETNQSIISVNAFNIVMTVITPIIIAYYLEFELSVEIVFFTCLFPLAFSLIFFAIPILRMPFVRYQNHIIKQKNQSLYILREIFSRLPKAIYPEKEAPSFAKAIPNLTVQKAKTAILQKAIELEAENQIDAQGEMYLDFSQINRELELKSI